MPPLGAFTFTPSKLKYSTGVSVSVTTVSMALDDLVYSISMYEIRMGLDFFGLKVKPNSVELDPDQVATVSSIEHSPQFSGWSTSRF